MLIAGNDTLIKFHGFPEFTPMLTPNAMLKLGVFGGQALWRNPMLNGIKALVTSEVPKHKYGQEFHTDVTNLFNVFAPVRNRDIELQYKSMHPSWFHWYSEFFYGRISPADTARIEQWKSEIKTFESYIVDWQDDSKQGYWKQNMVHFGWNPYKKPSDYGII